MAQPDDLEPRVGALEEDVQELRGHVRRSERDAAAARVLAGGAEHNVAAFRSEMDEFRGEVRSEFADVRAQMRSEFADVRAEIADLRTGLRAELRTGLADVRTELHVEVGALRTELHDYRDHSNRVLNAMRADITDLREHVDRGFMEMRGRLDTTAAGQQQIVDLLGRLISRDG
jgi:uncharacterized protein involved in exopolysaccharide biosynthesis